MPPGREGLTGSARGGGVGGDGPPGHRARLGLVAAAGDVGLAPALAAEPHELLALGGRGPRHALRGRAELRPALVADVRDVLDLQPRPVGRLDGETDLDPAHLAAVLPGGEEALRRVTALDRAARVAFELVAAAELQLTGYRQEPARDAFGAGAGVPDVLDGGGVGLADGDG